MSITSPSAKSVLELDEQDDELLKVIEAESGKGEDQSVEGSVTFCIVHFRIVTFLLVHFV